MHAIQLHRFQRRHQNIHKELKLQCYEKNIISQLPVIQLFIN